MYIKLGWAASKTYAGPREKRTVLVLPDESILHSENTIDWASVTAMEYVPCANRLMKTGQPVVVQKLMML